MTHQACLTLKQVRAKGMIAIWWDLIWRLVSGGVRLQGRWHLRYGMEQAAGSRGGHRYWRCCIPAMLYHNRHDGEQCVVIAM
jgi:hypothetical protein